ncbi:heparinase II/III domain-containing protein [Pelagovum pacificum]|uniref:Heparinase n=1 Tax=Pelagovum pacificum TaxID=2588711 RepID=A0A5C5GG39_9RHOB|nr:heparinase II/III family protein [Pelagovum pacificum]QQA43382.1 heparinase II/III family protein [Pelagovum pacificum]TNY33480.1 heparinase [Pelagovum pacificum]
MRDKLIARGDEFATLDWPHLTATGFAAFTRTGNRANYEAGWFTRRRKLNALVMAELAEGTGARLDDIADGLWLILEETGWQLPAHNAQPRGGARRPLPDPDDPVVDLFAAETGGLVATILDVLGEPLEAALPGLVARADAEVDRRILAPYLARDYWWMGNVDGPTNNWTTWITQNVLLAALVRPLGPDRRRAVLSRALPSLDAFLADYAEDGACEEGAMYYRHAGLCLWGALTLVNRAAPGSMDAVLATPKVRNIAEYVESAHVAGQNYLNFADCPAVGERATAREWLFGQAVGSDRLTAWAHRDATAEGWSDLPDEINLWYRLLQVQHAADLSAPPPPTPAPRDAWYPGSGLFIARDRTFTLAVKAGDNGDSHNHNDVGSVILYKSGRPVLIDLGVETYTAHTFSDRRYEIWTMQSGWHNLPTFGGVMQSPGEAHGARDVATDFGPEHAKITMDMAPAWPAEARLTSARRDVTLERGQQVLIRDTYDGALPATLTLLFAERPELAGNEVLLPALARIATEGLEDMVITHVPVADPRLAASWPDGVWRLSGNVRGSSAAVTID